ncbi:MAG: hypothetical protein ACPIOQ_67545 [Promethearchaeia archaeon]
MPAERLEEPCLSLHPRQVWEKIQRQESGGGLRGSSTGSSGGGGKFENRQWIAKGEVPGLDPVLNSGDGAVQAPKVVAGDPVFEKIEKMMAGDPVFEKFEKILEDEPEMKEWITDIMEKSNGNHFAVMANPKFQKFCEKMTFHPEMMQMMLEREERRNEIS